MACPKFILEGRDENQVQKYYVKHGLMVVELGVRISLYNFLNLQQHAFTNLQQQRLRPSPYYPNRNINNRELLEAEKSMSRFLSQLCLYLANLVIHSK